MTVREFHETHKPSNIGRAGYACDDCGADWNDYIRCVAPCRGKDRCGVCRFWGVKSNVTICRRRAPTAADEYGNVWPPVKEGQWCGEFERGPSL
jgi:hypothetical protein